MKAKQWLLTVALVGAMAAGVGPAWAFSGTSAAVTVRTQGLPVAGHAVAGYVPYKVESSDEAGLWLDGAVLFSSVGEKTFDWQPQTTGNHKIEFRLNGVAVTSKTVNVSSLAFWVQKGPNPPTAVDSKLSITPTTRNFGTGGGGAAIVVSGSGTWQASVSDSWITLNATSGAAGTPVAYVVGAATNAESRTGYVYVSGHVHTVTQDGLGATISPTSANYESAGGTGKITVTPPDRMSWQARANVDWVNVSPVSGTGNGTVTYTVAPLNEVTTRQGTLTVAGQTFTVFQYGRRIKISPKKAEYDYLVHAIPIVVDALAITTWSVTPQNSWISVVDGGNGHGGDTVTVAIGENPSWKARTGTVKIGTETFTVTQKGRTALEFSINPTSTTASVEGANGLIAVTATPDLPWSAASQANWLTIYSTTGTGAGNGNVVYSAAPNPTLYQRTGKIVVTPGDTKVSAKTHTVTQPAAVSALSANGYEFAAAGESCSVKVSVADIVEWQIQNTNAWLTVSGSTNRVGPGTVTLQASPNTTVYPKSGTVTIARKTFKVTQKARGVEVEYETKLFGTDGGDDSISIHPDGQVSWTAVSSDPSWLVIFGNASGTGDGEVMYIVAPYVGNGGARTATITVGDKVVYVTQRAYELSIDPAGSVVAGNNGAGEFGVSATIGEVWTAIVTEPWITLVSGYDKGTGNGTVRFLYTDNDTGKTRTGKIIVAGEVYTLTQRERQFVAVTAEAGRGGSVTGAGTYDLGTKVTLTAVPDSGYAFSYWTGAVESMQNPLTVTADVPKSYTAVFEPLPIAFESVTSGTNGVTLAWNNLAWATHYLLYRGVTSVPSSATVVADIPNTGFCTYLDETGEAWVEYWYWIEAQGVEDSVTSDPMTGTKLKSFVSVTAEAGHGGTVTGAGTYDRGTKVTLTAVPDSGYAFSYWTGAVESVQNPLTVTADVPKTCTAVFEPLPIAFESVVSGTNGVTLAWNHLAWATHYLLYRGVTSVPSSATVVADLPNTGVCTYLDETGEMEVEYWYWIEAEGIEDDVTSDPMTGTKLKAPAWPDVKDAAGVAAVLAGAADARLAERIATVEEYDAFRAWIAAKGLDEEAVKASAQAWPSYLLGAEGLFENEPVIQIEGFSMGGEAEGSRAAGAAWTVRVTVKDGENAAAVDAEKVAARFEASRQPGDWSEAALLPLTVSTKGKDGDALLFDVTIESGTVAFLRLGSGEAVVVEPEVPSSGAKYLVVDLSAGADAEAYPVTYLDEPPNGGFNTDEYKTTKLVLRRIEAGTFTMGESDCEDNPPHQVTLTKPYYVGLFEVTQKQYELVTGSKPSSNSGDKRPVEWVSWDTIRGNSGWPASSAVSADSFMGRIRARTGLGDFDLPTEAQWEYACRAGTTTTYSYGNSADWNYMWYGSNSSSQTHDVGTTKPNPWGLYDMHGNVWEWCLDWYGTMSGGTNPKGSSSGSYRVSRGGSWDWDAGYCTSSYRGYSRPSYYNGFRLVRTLSE